jgi:hypothetical protein
LPKYLARMPRISRLVDPQGHGNSRKAASPLESVTFSGAMADFARGGEAVDFLPSPVCKNILIFRRPKSAIYPFRPRLTKRGVSRSSRT